MGNCISLKRKRSNPRVDSTTKDEIGNSTEGNSTEGNSIEDSLPVVSSPETIPSESVSDLPAESSAPLLNHCPEPSSPPNVDPPVESTLPLLNHYPEPPSSPSTSLCPRPRPVFGTDAENEFTELKKAYDIAIQVNHEAGTIQFGSLQLVNETINRINWLMDAAEETTMLHLVFNHLSTLKMILLACKAEYCQSNTDRLLSYTLFHDSIISFCGDLEMYSEYREGDIKSHEMHQMGVDETITDCRNLAVHSTFKSPKKEYLILNLMKCLVWYGKYLWPNLSISRNPSGAQFLHYKMRFPKAQIYNQKIRGGLKITKNYCPSFDAFAVSVEVQPDDEWLSGISFQSLTFSEVRQSLL